MPRSCGWGLSTGLRLTHSNLGLVNAAFLLSVSWSHTSSSALWSISLTADVVQTKITSTIDWTAIKLWTVIHGLQRKTSINSGGCMTSDLVFHHPLHELAQKHVQSFMDPWQSTHLNGKPWLLLSHHQALTEISMTPIHTLTSNSTNYLQNLSILC